ncbi:MAG: peptide chain release factor 3 [Alphaproteobacteria bacterium]
MSQLEDQVKRRRTFAIISHPDAGKTTLTEKLLLFGGAIQAAGAVKARGEARRARSDWMKVEKERGISVASSVMSFDYAGCTFNLLDTPGHEDFSEDTYRTLTAVDSAVMVLDGAKGIESQTRKLFEVCRMRDVPIMTFINKMDREARDNFEILDEIEQELALEVTPASWPIGMGRRFKGCYDLIKNQLVLVEKGGEQKGGEIATLALDDPKLDELIGETDAEELREQVEMAQGLCPPLERQPYLEGYRTPVYFGSAINNFGVRELLDGLASMAPPPRPQPTNGRMIEPTEEGVSGFVFKIQANMDPRHRDRIAFFRVSSGHFKKGAKLKHVRSGKVLNLHNPQRFLAQDREVATDAFPGDIIGLPNHGNLRIGDTLTEGEDFQVTGIPSFAPEYLQRVRPEDPMKAKHLGRALQQLAEEGVARVFKPTFDSNWIVGVVGVLQFEVLADRIRTEYDIPVLFEQTQLHTARWVEGDERELKAFNDANRAAMAVDHDGAPVFLARNAWHLQTSQDNHKTLKFLATREQT